LLMKLILGKWHFFYTPQRLEKVVNGNIHSLYLIVVRLWDKQFTAL
jgi:hypothetical protein